MVVLCEIIVIVVSLALFNAAGVTLAQFRSWNTQIDESCTNLWVDYYVCIGV
jgi:hypothetical protein